MIKNSMFKKLIAVFLIVATLFMSVGPSVVHAQRWYDQGPADWYTKVYDESNPSEIFGERYTAAQIDWIIYSVIFWLPTKVIGPDAFSCALSLDIANCVGSVFTTPGEGQSFNLENKTDQSFASAYFEERPISAITYVKDLGRKLNLVPAAQAQEGGFGFQAGLSPILPMWRASRDIAYALVVVAIIILSFMIMFRIKISPQVVITAQSALPKIAIALLLITFSYAIAGLLVDLMYVVIGLISLLGQSFFPFDPSPTSIFNLLTKGHLWDAPVQAGAFGIFAIFIVLLLLGLLFTLVSYLGLAISGVGATLAIFGIGAATGTGVGGAILFLIAIVIIALITIVAGWVFLKTVWTLVKAYASILLLTIFAPFQMLLGTIVPSLGFGSWVKSFISKLAVFVVIGTLFMLALAFTFQGVVLTWGEHVGDGAVQTIFNTLLGTRLTDAVTPGVQGTPSWPPLLGLGGDTGAAFLLYGAAFVVFTMIPKASELIESLIEGRPFSYGSAIGSMFTPFTAAANLGPVKGTRELMAQDRMLKIYGKLGEQSVLPESIQDYFKNLHEMQSSRLRKDS